MSQPFEFAIEDDRDIPIANSHLVWGRCKCGARALHAAGQASECSVCRRVRVGGAPDLTGLLRRYSPVIASARDKREASAFLAPEREAYPAPEWTSRDGVVVPAAGVVLSLAGRAQSEGWGVRVQCSRGSFPHGSTGKPLKARTLHAVLLARGDWRAYAVRDEAAWTSVMIWGAGTPFFPHASITDLNAFIDARGEVGSEWFEAIRVRVAGAEARTKAREACNRGVHPLAETQVDVVWCPTCLNSWKTSDNPWRKPKVGKSEAL